MSLVFRAPSYQDKALSKSLLTYLSNSETYQSVMLSSISQPEDEKLIVKLSLDNLKDACHNQQQEEFAAGWAVKGACMFAVSGPPIYAAASVSSPSSLS